MLNALIETALRNRFLVLMGTLFIAGDSPSMIIGGTTTNPATANLVSGNTGTAITLATGTRFNQLLGNSIGVDRFGLPVLPNMANAIAVIGSSTSNTSAAVRHGFGHRAGARIPELPAAFGYITINRRGVDKLVPHRHPYRGPFLGVPQQNWK